MEPAATFAVGVRVTDTTAFTTVAVYVYVLDAKLGVNVPELIVKLLSSASELLDADLVTVTVYVFVANPLGAVTTTCMAVDPTISACAAETVPDTTLEPPTVTNAASSVVIGVSLYDDTALVTVTVYEKVPAANDGESAPTLPSSEDSVASVWLELSE
jgi:hypothetical protein